MKYYIKEDWIFRRELPGCDSRDPDKISVILAAKFPQYLIIDLHRIVADNGRLSIHHYLGDNSLPLYFTCLYVGRIFVSSTST